MRLFLKSFLAIVCATGLALSVSHAQEDNAGSEAGVVEAIVGHWKPSVEKTKEALGDEMPPGMIEELANISIKFNDDGSMAISNDGEVGLEAKWSAVAREGEENVYDIKLMAELMPEALEGVITFIDENTVELKPGDEPPAILERVMTTSDLLVGNWGGDVDATIEALTASGAEVNEELTAGMSQAVSGMGVDIAGDGTYVLHVAGAEDVNGTWTVEKNDDGEHVLNAVPETGDEELMFVIEFNEDNSVVSMSPTNGDAAVFFRRK